MCDVYIDKHIEGLSFAYLVIQRHGRNDKTFYGVNKQVKSFAIYEYDP